MKKSEIINLIVIVLFGGAIMAVSSIILWSYLAPCFFIQC